MSNKPTAIVVHHEAASNGLKAVNHWHRYGKKFPISSLGWFVGYQYYVNLQGVITQTRDENEEGMHTLGGWNKKSVGICLMGHLGLQVPTDDQLGSIKGLVETIQKRWSIPNNRIYSHKELWPTACPGFNGMKVVEKLRETKPDLRKLEKQIALMIELVNKLKVLLRLLLKRK